ncbi:helix-turn-helix domain-containing protein [Nocardioides daejeonensis]|uniref:helix-turn-helix domain-containing protein n=1 Tax=Nocardioides daejeonensis TaxID=1046556 RepID=UPI000D74D60B|nr:XRE family transcriptional regulator [Nocardioides daejeonensis]
MESMTDVGRRIRRGMPHGLSQRALAQQVGMTPDALSRALNGQRGLSAVEVAAIASVLGVDTHWLITGQADPLKVSVAARHSWDAQRRERVNDGRTDDQAILDQIVAVYRAAFPQGPPASSKLPASPGELRGLLGSSFVREFADTSETRLGIDVIRIPGLKTDYSLRIGERGVVVLATQSSWFRSNWSLAHELGHLALDHHSPRDGRQPVQREEKEADRFAADLLLPSAALHRIANATDATAVAAMIWELGVSTEAIRNQLRTAGLRPALEVGEALLLTTPRLLRDNLHALPSGEKHDPIMEREQASSARRFPLSLLSALQDQTERGAASPVLLAWALEVPVDDLEFPEPIDEDAAVILARITADRPTAAEWRSIVAGSTER